MPEEKLHNLEAKNKSEMSSMDALELYGTLERLGVEIWVDGGWGVDALLEKQTRMHKDLDIAIQEKDVPKLRELLGSRGYRDIKLEEARPHNFVLADAEGHEIDLHVIALDGEGNGIYGPAKDGQMYPAASLTGTGRIGDHQVRCISPEWLVKFHSGYELKEKDFKDVSAICEKFGIELPEEYRRMKSR